jgi:hypothetical protein
MNNDKSLKIEPIRAYIRENIDLFSDSRDTELFESLHIEIYDKYEKNTLYPKNIINTMSRIKEVEESLKTKSDAEL